MSTKPAVALRGLTSDGPAARSTLGRVDGTLNMGRAGFGRNVAGKSTLLRLIAGPSPTSGAMDAAGEAGYLIQPLTLTGPTSITELLGIDRALAAPLRQRDRGRR